MRRMFRALLICSDGNCAEMFEAYGSLDELEALACDCGCSLHVLALDEQDCDEQGFDLARAA
jgi:hypothetical protein